jgi:steroid delta-isomerase-like uncharacterized protein
MTEVAEIPQETTEEMARALLQAACDATWNAHDSAALAANAHADAVMRVVPTGEAAQGPAGIQALAESRLSAFPDWHLQVTDAFVAGDRICGQLTLTGTHDGEFLGHAPTGRSFELSLCCVFRLRDGRLVEEVIYFDLASLLGQLGIQAA